MEWKEIKLFISSTFNDMHAERDYLVTEVFPELRDWCEKRHIRLTDIDLRWGISSDDADMKNTVLTCLECIDECRPFFLCFIGQRRGWVPDKDYYTTRDDVVRYNELKSLFGTASVTEIEIEHAALSPMMHVLSESVNDPGRCRAFFYFRENPFGSVLTDEQRKIYTNAGSDDETLNDMLTDKLKARIRQGWHPRDYSCRWDPNLITDELRYLGDTSHGRLTDFRCDGKPLRDEIIEALETAIAEEFPEQMPPDSVDLFDEDAEEQHMFALMEAADFIGREALVDEVRSFIEEKSECNLLCITGNEGQGKTALLSKTWTLENTENSKVLFRSCGVTDKSVTENDLYLSLGNEAGLFRASELSSATYRHVDTKFLNKLSEAGYKALILDSVERLPKYFAPWKFNKVPDGFKVIISSNETKLLNELVEEYREIEIPPIDNRNEQRLLIEGFLKRSLKKLNNEQTDHLLCTQGASIPLYLRTVCNELRTFGSFTALSDKLKKFGDTTESAFNEVIATIETEWEGNEKLVPYIIGLLSFSRGGLSQEEILHGLNHIGIDDENMNFKLGMLLRRLRPYLYRANGRYEIRYSIMVKCAKSRYRDLEECCRRALVSVYIENMRAVDNPKINEGIIETHGSKELLYQQAMLEDYDGIRAALHDESLLSKIPPGMYYCESYNGTFYASDEEDELGYCDGDPESAAGRTGMMAKLIREKAIECLETIKQNYTQPYARECARLRALEDVSEYLRYRDQFYDMISYACGALVFEKFSLKKAVEAGYRDRIESDFVEFMSQDRGMFSFVDHLALDGSDETGLSHQIEDMALGVDIGKEKIRKVLTST